MKKLPIIFITFFSVGINWHWFSHKASHPNFFIEINILTAFVIMFVGLGQPLNNI